MEIFPKYRLDPPRSGAQHALISVTSMTESTFIVDQVQLLTPDEAKAATTSLKQLMLLTRRIYAPDRKRGGEWDEMLSPVSAKKCRFLGRCLQMLPFLSHETYAKLCDSTVVMVATMISSCCYSAANRIITFFHAKISSRRQIIPLVLISSLPHCSQCERPELS